MSFYRRPITSNAQRHQLVNEFEAFDDEGDDELDALVLSSNSTNRASHHQVITLGEPTNPGTLYSSGGEESIPGAYDFEPQAYDGAPTSTPPSISTSSRPSPLSPTSQVSTTGRSRVNNSISIVSRFLPTAIVQRLGLVSPANNSESEGEGHGLLFSSTEGEEDETGDRTSYPPQSHLPLPSRPPSFLPPGTVAPTRRIIGSGQGNDGVVRAPQSISCAVSYLIESCCSTVRESECQT
jgi:hypothetical protein